LTPNRLPESNSSSHNDLDTTQYKQNPTRFYPPYHHRIQQGQRTHSETHLYHEQEPVMHFSPHYGSRLVNGSRAPISTNPLWTRPSPTSAGSQPNLFSPSLADSSPFYYQFNPRHDLRLLVQVHNRIYSHQVLQIHHRFIINSIHGQIIRNRICTEVIPTINRIKLLNNKNNQIKDK